MSTFTGTTGDDEFGGTFHHDTYLLGAGGNDTANGGFGADLFVLNDALNPLDVLTGGEGVDELDLDGDYSIVFTATTITSIERITLAAGGSYVLSFNDGNVAAGGTLEIDGSAVGAGDQIIAGDDGETDGNFHFIGGLGNDTFDGGALGDEFDLTIGGDDRAFAGGGDDHIVAGGGDNFINGDDGDDVIDLTTGGKDNAGGSTGDDVITIGATFRASDRINGGADHDELQLDGDYSFGLTLASNTMRGIEVLLFTAGNDYSVVLDDGNVAADETLLIDGSTVGGKTVEADGSAETDGQFAFHGANGKDHFIGGDQNDVFFGNGNADLLEGGGGADRFGYTDASNSTSTAHDTVVGFDAQDDVFDLPFSLRQIDAPVSGGTLRNGSFDADLSAAIGGGQLGKHEAVLFTPDAGNLAGHTFLIVDANKVKGYQAGADLVFDLVDAKHLGALDVDNFV